MSTVLIEAKLSKPAAHQADEHERVRPTAQNDATLPRPWGRRLRECCPRRPGVKGRALAMESPAGSEAGLGGDAAGLDGVEEGLVVAFVLVGVGG
jgi:hypothetical protein